jgi:phenylpropionate dioxygenase-like ring-hydroxylating dioxygenase large terminal subunit
MPDDAVAYPRSSRAWPAGLTRVPFWTYKDPAVLRLEQQRLFEGPVWNYLCLETEIPNDGDWRTTYVGEMPVVVARDHDGGIVAFENRCAHRGALICLDDAGNAREFQCVYHAWRYDLRGNLRSVAFQHGVNGNGGMPGDFRVENHGPRKLRTTTLFGIVFGTLSGSTPDIETFAGPGVIDRLRTAASGRTLEIIGRFTEVLPNNWKLYAENVRDTYHASLLHLFFATFKLNRLSQGGGTQINEAGSCHVSTTLAPDQEVDHAYDGMRSVDDDFRLNDPSLLDAVDEHGDRVRQQIISVFPNFVMQRTQNVMAVRHFLPRGVDKTELHWIFLGYADDSPELRTRRLRQINLGGPAGYVSMEDGCVGGFVERGAAAAHDRTSILEMGGTDTESQDTRATEAAIRGFWRFWRGLVGV